VCVCVCVCIMSLFHSPQGCRALGLAHVRGLRMGEVKEASASIVVHAPIADVCSK